MSDLIVIEKTSVQKVFSDGGIDPILKKIEDEVSGIVIDVSTSKGRKELASMAHKVAKTKTYLDGIGKDLVSSIKQQAKVIDQERKKARDYLDNLKEKVRQPLTEWEETESKRIDAIKERVNEIALAYKRSYGQSIEASEMLQKIKSTPIDESFAEFTSDAAIAKDAAINYLEQEVVRLEKYEADQAELERLLKEREEQEKKDREERIAKEAADRARKEAEEKAEKERLSAMRREQEAKAEAERLAKEKEEAIKKAEKERVAALAKAEKEKKEAIERANREAKEAADRKEAERLSKERAEKERLAILAANKEHRRKINKQALADLVKHGLGESESKLLIAFIANGDISHITINY